jgi:ParB family transcriptional regulator, chromosome partitioning protein
MKLVLPIDSIVVTSGRRSLDPAKVAELAESIAAVGLLSPIIVRARGKERFLVAGLHRLEATRRLGRVDIEADVIECEDIDARLAEIAENLHRAELSALERAEQLSEWVLLTAEKSKGAQVAPPGGAQPHKKGIKAAVRDLGLKRTELQRAVKINAIAPEAKAAAKEADLDDNQSALLKVASEPPSRQVGAVKQLAAAKQQTRSGPSERTERAACSRAALADLVALLLERREEAMRVHQLLKAMLPAQLAGLKDSLAKALLPTASLGQAPVPADATLFPSKDAAIAAARAKLGVGAKPGEDFAVRRTPRGEWYWYSANRADVRPRGSLQ